MYFISFQVISDSACEIYEGVCVVILWFITLLTNTTLSDAVSVTMNILLYDDGLFWYILYM